MENLRTLISGFLGLVIQVRWALVTMFLSWTTQAGCRIHRTYVSLIGSGEGRHTTHLLTFFLTYLLTFFLTNLLIYLLTSFWHIFWHSFWHLSDISFDILSDKSFDTLSDISSDILSDISFDMLSDISSDILSDISKPKPNIQSFTKKAALQTLYLPRTTQQKYVPVNVIALSASDRPAKRQLSPKMQNACSSTHTHTTCIRPPRQKAVESKNTKEFWSATTTSHGVCKPWSQMLATAVLAPVLHRWPCSARCLSPIHALHPPKTRPKYERLQRASPALARPPHLEQASLHMPHTTCFPPRLLPW